MDNQQGTVTDIEIGWIVGIFEGEGCFRLSKTQDNQFKPMLIMSNTNFEIIEEFVRIVSKLNVGCYICTPKVYKAYKKPLKRVEINGILKVKKFLDFFLPHFHCRHSQAKILKDFVDLRLSKDHKEPYGSDEYSLYYILKELNKRGTDTSETEC